MTTIHSVVNQPNDQFGYSCYALVLPASEELTEKIEDLRNTLGVTAASIPAHITIKGTFFSIESLDKVKQVIAAITQASEPFFISFENWKLKTWPDACALTVDAIPPQQALHDALVAQVSPLGLPAYRDDPYVVHMTLFYEQSPENQERGVQLIEQMDFGPGFLADRVNLMGRVGPRYGGEWKLIESFQLG